METDKIVAQWLDTIATLWGRELTEMAVNAYLVVARAFPVKTVAQACETLLRERSMMPLPADLRRACSELAPRAERKYYIPEKVERARAEHIRKAMENFYKRTGQKRPQ